VLSGEEEQRLTERVVVSVFSVIPGTEEFLGRDDITNVMVVGNDPVRAQLQRRVGDLPPMVERDEDLIESCRPQPPGGIGGVLRDRPMLELQLRRVPAGGRRG
jgi:hypothetical protein